MKYLFAVFLFSSLLFSQSTFEGTWEMKMDTIELSGPPEEYLLENGMYHCITCVPRVDVEMNGVDQKVVGHPNFDTIAIRAVYANSVKFVQKKNGQPTFTCTETVSTDGRTMTEEFSETPSSQRVTGYATFTRVMKGPVGAHPLSGSWQMRTIRNVSKRSPTVTYQWVGNGLRITEGGTATVVKFDGKDHPVEGEPQRTVSLRMIDGRTVEETDKQDGRVVRTVRMTVSKDGKSMKVHSNDEVRGGEMSYTAEKRP
jgi:hypothetical protein